MLNMALVALLLFAVYLIWKLVEVVQELLEDLDRDIY